MGERIHRKVLMVVMIALGCVLSIAYLRIEQSLVTDLPAIDLNPSIGIAQGDRAASVDVGGDNRIVLEGAHVDASREESYRVEFIDQVTGVRVKTRFRVEGGGGDTDGRTWLSSSKGPVLVTGGEQMFVRPWQPGILGIAGPVRLQPKVVNTIPVSVRSRPMLCNLRVVWEDSGQVLQAGSVRIVRVLDGEEISPPFLLELNGEIAPMLVFPNMLGSLVFQTTGGQGEVLSTRPRQVSSKVLVGLCQQDKPFTLYIESARADYVTVNVLDDEDGRAIDACLVRSLNPDGSVQFARSDAGGTVRVPSDSVELRFEAEGLQVRDLQRRIDLPREVRLLPNPMVTLAVISERYPIPDLSVRVTDESGKKVDVLLDDIGFSEPISFGVGPAVISIDCGSGTIQELVEIGSDPDQVFSVFLDSMEPLNGSLLTLHYRGGGDEDRNYGEAVVSLYGITGGAKKLIHGDWEGETFQGVPPGRYVGVSSGDDSAGRSFSFAIEVPPYEQDVVVPRRRVATLLLDQVSDAQLHLVITPRTPGAMFDRQRWGKIGFPVLSTVVSKEGVAELPPLTGGEYEFNLAQYGKSIASGVVSVPDYGHIVVVKHGTLLRSSD